MTTFTVHPELFRILAYAGFWSMSALATAITNALIKDIRVDWDNTDLIKTFGFNNICSNWDYPPAREITAMYYPLVEYPLQFYLLLTFLQVRQSATQRLIPPWLYYLIVVMMAVQFVLVSWFRMIFVVYAPTDIKGHTLGFFGLQFAFALNCLHNVAYNQYIGSNWFPCTSLSASRVFMWTYCGLVCFVTAFKLTHTIMLLYAPGGSFIDVQTPSGAAIAQAADTAWMALVAVMPIGIAWLQWRAEPALQFVMSLVDSNGATVAADKAEATEHLELSVDVPPSNAEDPNAS